MRFRPLFLSSLLVSAVVVGVALDFGRRARAHETARHEIRQRQARLETQIASAAKALAESQRASESLRAELARAVPAAASKPAEPAPVNDVQPLFLKELMANDPNLQRMHLENERLTVQGHYGMLFAALGLNAGQIARLTEAILAHGEQRLDIDGVMRTQRLAESDPAIVALRRKAEVALEAVEREVLGEAGYAKLQEHERTRAVRGDINTLAGKLAVDGLPLSAEQGEQLVQVLAEANTSYRAGKAADFPWAAIQATGNPLWRGPLPDTFDWNFARQRARAILTDAQFVYFEQKIASYEGVQLINMVVKAKAADPGGR